MTQKLTGQQIREKFAQYFMKQMHEKVASSSLIPHNDKTLLFANAGMNQFKDYFTGKATAQNKRAVSIQKCVRAGGKHNDLENVGHTARHHTFFEMLGNFSFGDYFKEDAIKFAWEFLTVELQIPKEKLYVTVHYSDDEARGLWKKITGMSDERIFNKGDKDNFWEMGEYGPCGPCSEIFFDHGEQYTDKELVRKDPNDLLEDEKRYIEIWNLVFMQFEKTPDGKFSLPKPSIDTGAGLERVTAAIQGCYNNYNSDIFAPIMKKIEDLSGKKYLAADGTDLPHTAAFRVVADHIRSSTMLITDGVIPSNEGRGYVLRRIIRRAIKYLNELGVKEISFYKLIPAVFESLGKEYPQNAQNAELAQKFLELEEKKFRETLDNGLKYLNEAIEKEVKNGILPGTAAFRLYDSYGFPLDLTEIYLAEKKLSLDHAGFDKAMQEQKERSQKSWKGSFDMGDKVFHAIKEKHGHTQFVGYEKLESKARLVAIENVGEFKALVFDYSPFYAEGGGQAGDTGVVLMGNNVIAHVEDTLKPVDGLHVHLSKDADALEVGQNYHIRVDEKSRKLTQRNHSATHLLQSALIKVLGNHVKQAGSSVGPDRLRFDFTHLQAMNREEIERVEKLVNEAIAAQLPVNAHHMSMDAAIKKGAMALFGEKYGDVVRVMEMGEFSTELCGGTHVTNTSEIGLFTIVTETSLATGVRRIEALTSETALQYLNNRSVLLKRIEAMVNDKDDRAIGKVENLYKDLKEKQKEIEQLKEKIQAHQSQDLFKHVDKFSKGSYACIEAPEDADLRKLSDLFVSKFQDGVVLLHNKKDGKAAILIRAAKHVTGVDAGAILKETLPMLNGRGGGKPDLAQGSGEPNNFSAFSQKVKELVESKLK